MEPPPYVSQADGDTIEVNGADDAVTAALIELGFAPHADRPDALMLSVDGDEDKAEVFAALRDAGIYFSSGREWNPVEVYQWLCEKGSAGGTVSDGQLGEAPGASCCARSAESYGRFRGGEA